MVRAQTAMGAQPCRGLTVVSSYHVSLGVGGYKAPQAVGILWFSLNISFHFKKMFYFLLQSS